METKERFDREGHMIAVLLDYQLMDQWMEAMMEFNTDRRPADP